MQVPQVRQWICVGMQGYAIRLSLNPTHHSALSIRHPTAIVTLRVHIVACAESLEAIMSTTTPLNGDPTITLAC